MLHFADFALQEQLEDNLMVSISRAWYNGSYTMAAKPIKSLELHYTQLTQLSHSFSRLGCKIWNELPESFRAKTKASFKKCLQTRLLKLLDQEDIYVDVNTLIKNFKYHWYD